MVSVNHAINVSVMWVFITSPAYKPVYLRVLGPANMAYVLLLDFVDVSRATICMKIHVCLYVKGKYQ